MNQESRRGAGREREKGEGYGKVYLHHDGYSASSISSLLYSPTALTAKDSSRALTGSDPTSHCIDKKIHNII